MAMKVDYTVTFTASCDICGVQQIKTIEGVKSNDAFSQTGPSGFSSVYLDGMSVYLLCRSCLGKTKNAIERLKG